MVTLPLTQQNIIYFQLHYNWHDLSLQFQLTRVANIVLVITELNCDLRPRFQSSSNMVSYKLWMKNEHYLSNKWKTKSFISICSHCVFLSGPGRDSIQKGLCGFNTARVSCLPPYFIILVWWILTTDLPPIHNYNLDKENCLDVISQNIWRSDLHCFHAKQDVSQPVRGSARLTEIFQV